MICSLNTGPILRIAFSLLGWFNYEVNWHQIIDERNFEMDQVIADLLERDPAKLGVAEKWIGERLDDPQYSAQSKGCLREWLDLIGNEGVFGVIATLRSQNQEASRLRQCSPFGTLMPAEERLKILGRYEARRTRTHSAGV